MSHGRTKESLFSKLARWSLNGVLLLLPWMVFPWSGEGLEFGKQTVLIIGVLFAMLFWIIDGIQQKKLIIRDGWLGWFMLPIVITAAISASFSDVPYLSWVGTSLQEYTSVLSVSIMVLAAFLVPQVFTRNSHQRYAWICMGVSALGTMMLGIWVLLWQHPILFLAGGERLFTPVGTTYAFAIFAAAITAGSLFFLLSPAKDRSVLTGISKWLSVVLLISSLSTLILVDAWVAWVGLLISIVTLGGIHLLRRTPINPERWIPLFGVLLTSLLFLVILPSPVADRFPVEITPNTTASWQVVQKTWEATSPLIGSGPGTFVFDFASFRPQELNETPFWQVRFDRGSSFFLTLLATTGVLGAAAWGIFILSLLGAGIYVVVKQKGELASVWLAAWIVLAAASCFYPSNMVLLVLLFFSSGHLLSTNKDTHPIFTESTYTHQKSMTAVVVATSLVGCILLFSSLQRGVAEWAYAQAIKVEQGGGGYQEMVKHLDRAARFNRFHDVYHRSLAQALLVHIKEELAQSEQELEEEEELYLKSLAQAVLQSAQKATTSAPGNARNWQTTGQIYRDLVPLIDGAEEQAVVAFEQAQVLEPHNPILLVELSQVYMAAADQRQQISAAAESTSEKTVAQKEASTFLENAEKTINTALETKLDYAPAHFQLGLIYERQGRLSEAIGKLESVKQYHSEDVGVMFQLGLLYLRRAGEGDLLRAQREFERVVEFVPSYTNAHWFLSSVYEQQGEHDKAIGELLQILEYNAEHPLVTARIERLRKGEEESSPPEPLETQKQAE